MLCASSSTTRRHLTCRRRRRGQPGSRPGMRRSLPSAEICPRWRASARVVSGHLQIRSKIPLFCRCTLVSDSPHTNSERSQSRRTPYSWPHKKESTRAHQNRARAAGRRGPPARLVQHGDGGAVGAARGLLALRALGGRDHGGGLRVRARAPVAGHDCPTRRSQVSAPSMRRHAQTSAPFKQICNLTQGIRSPHTHRAPATPDSDKRHGDTFS